MGDLKRSPLVIYMDMFKMIFNLCFSIFSQEFFDAQFFQFGFWVTLMVVPFLMVRSLFEEV